MSGLFLMNPCKRWQRVNYDRDATEVKYREVSGTTYPTVLTQGASAVPISDAAKIVLNNPDDTSIGYDVYEWGKVHWFKFPEGKYLGKICKVAVLYNCANSRCNGNVNAFVVQGSQDSDDGSNGTWHSGVITPGNMPILYGDEATNIRDVVFPIDNIKMLRIATQGIAWNLSDRIHTIRIYTLTYPRSG